MSQDYIFNTLQQSHSIRRDKLRMQGFEPLVGLEDVGTSGMLSEMFNFPTDLVQNQMNYQKEEHNVDVGEWYGDCAQSMQVFLMNPSHEYSSSQSSSQHHHRLSLSLSSNLQHFEATKVEELRIGDDPGTGMLYFNQRGSGGNDLYQNMQLMSPTHHPIHVGYGSSTLGVVKALRTSRYVKAAQELLEEFCGIGRGELRTNKSGLKRDTNRNPSSSEDGGDSSSASFKDLPPLSSAERIEHKRRKTKLVSMLDEVDQRYNHYCEQMQIVVSSFDTVLGHGAAVPYTALARKAMSRHFRCLKDAIAAQLKHSCGLLGEKDVATSRVTKGETPRLKLLEQSLRQQKAYHQMGMIEPQAWRPQRGLPERSVNILRAWLFEHFLHPYPSDADKHLLARQTGLSRNQVSNWFINARVRLWKPMLEEMYQQESKEKDGNHTLQEQQEDKESLKYHSYKNNINNNNNQPPPPPTTTTTLTHAKRSEINDSKNDPSIFAINAQYCNISETQANTMSYQYSHISNTNDNSIAIVASPPFDGDTCRRSTGYGVQFRNTAGDDVAADIGSRLIRFGTTSGDMSLTLGLHHAGNLPE